VGKLSHDCEANAATSRSSSVHVSQPHVTLEHAPSLRGWNTGPLVVDEDLRAIRDARERNDDPRSASAELHGVGEQIEHHLSHGGRVHERGEAALELSVNLYVAAFRERP